MSIASMNTFSNHACDAQKRNSATMNFDLDSKGNDALFSPIGKRRKLVGHTTVATRDIQAGEEIVMDYLELRTNPTKEFSELLGSFCRGEGLVPVDYVEEE